MKKSIQIIATAFAILLGNFGFSQNDTIYFVKDGAVVNKQSILSTDVDSAVFYNPFQLATLSTTTVSSITETSAVSGGNITDNGGATVTSRGICWGTSSNPTPADNSSVNGSGAGSFASNLSGLTGGTTYYVRAYAINSVGTSYGNEVSFTTTSTLVAIGEVAHGGIVAYILQSGDVGYDANFQHGLIAAPTDQGTAEWGCPRTMISGADGTEIGTGNQNTADILAGCSETNIAAYFCDTLTLGGYSDWFLPSKDELNKLYENIGQGNALGLGNVGGFANNDYWSSTESGSANAWRQYFYGGYQFSSNKASNDDVRAVRAF